ncbi:cation diffusion facilitator family transporter [Bacteriovorax sp. BAL6_X]|uniref:CDF family Co(II)/Ni(II) efflux transporter DmeF n=1 Tax=Bacteriovorax sp. BAL6_X TaxID=1201290 RepID=UPI0003863123|nr:CDF family Co(II)/Ni(II) efflux transporter DmeF [Bacteriovorax sp. BAL6_X]EPZ51888.1 cation diffusion facilitator family transporter [Bacteriovorax sp. BAL6_X]
MKHEEHLESHNFVLDDARLGSNERKTILVIILTFVTMVVEIGYGYFTGSMALLADGWHMSSHVGALGITVIVYRLARSEKINKKLSFGAGKMIPLGGYTSALMLGIVAVVMGVESIGRFLNPMDIKFETAIIVAIIGLIVNILSAILLWDSQGQQHGHGQDQAINHVHDHNHRSALLHVIADALTSVMAIAALFTGKYFGWLWADPIIGILGAIVILKWAWGLAKDTVWELLDGNSKLFDEEEIRKLFAHDEDIEIADLHLWRIAPNAHACEVMIYNCNLKGSEYYREKILAKYDISHLIVEERLCSK